MNVNVGLAVDPISKQLLMVPLEFLEVRKSRRLSCLNQITVCKTVKSWERNDIHQMDAGDLGMHRRIAFPDVALSTA